MSLLPAGGSLCLSKRVAWERTGSWPGQQQDSCCIGGISGHLRERPSRASLPKPCALRPLLQSCRLVPMDKLDLRLVQIVYTNGGWGGKRAWPPLVRAAPDRQPNGMCLLRWCRQAEARACLHPTQWHAVPCALPNLTPRICPTPLCPPLVVPRTGDIAAIRTMGPAPSLSPANIIAAPPVVAPDFMWRDVLSSLTLPGLVIAGALLATIPERRKAASGTASSTSGSTAGSVSGLPALAAAGAAAAGGGAQALTAATEQPAQPQPQRPGLLSLLRTPPFMATTLAASFNDVASYALIAWQSTLYERVYGLTAASYAPVLATLLPVGGILGGGC